MVSIVARKIGRDERAVIMVLYPMTFNVILTALVLPFVYVPVELGDLGLLAVDAILVLVAMSLLVAAYTHASATAVAPMQYSQIIWATIFGILLFEEYPEWQTYLGITIIALSGFYVLHREARAGVSRNTPVTRTRTRIGHALALRVGQRLQKNERADD